MKKQIPTNSVCSFSNTDFYKPDKAFEESLKFRCLLLLDENSNSFNFFKFSKVFGWWSSHKFSYHFASFALLFFVLGGSFYFTNLSENNLNTDFVLTQVYAENPQTNLMPFLLVSSNFNSFQSERQQNINPSYIPLVEAAKKYTYGHVGYEVRKGDALRNCENVYPFPGELTKVEAYEYVDENGKAYYKVFSMGEAGRLENYMVFRNGELVRVNEDGTIDKTAINLIEMDINVQDILGHLPETIKLSRLGSHYLKLEWQKRVMCNGDKLETMIINILVEKEGFKIRKLSTYLNTDTEHNLMYTIDFVSRTQDTYDFNKVESNFEVQNANINLL